MAVPIGFAASKAIEFAKEVLGSERTQGIRLEEVESATEGDVPGGDPVWHLTFSMLATNEADTFPGKAISASALAAFAPRNRDYKIFSVHKATGEVIAMKIREISPAA